MSLFSGIHHVHLQSFCLRRRLANLIGKSFSTPVPLFVIMAWCYPKHSTFSFVYYLHIWALCSHDLGITFSNCCICNGSVKRLVACNQWMKQRNNILHISLVITFDKLDQLRKVSISYSCVNWQLREAVAAACMTYIRFFYLSKKLQERYRMKGNTTKMSVRLTYWDSLPSFYWYSVKLHESLRYTKQKCDGQIVRLWH